MKKFYLLLVAMVAMMMPAHAEDSGSCGEHLTWAYDPSTKTFTVSGYGAMKDYSNAGDRPWDALASEVESLVLPEGLTYVGMRAFSGFNNAALTTINWPSTLTSLGMNAFVYCNGLKTLTIPECMTDFSAGAFRGCTGLESVTFLNDTVPLGDAMFAECYNLMSVTIPNTVDSIIGETFEHCPSLTSITLPDSLKFLGNGTFLGCSKITSITLPEGLTYLGAAAFKKSGLTSLVIPEGVPALLGSTFQECGQLAWVDIPSSVQSIGWGDFMSCGQLKDLYVHWDDPKDIEIKDWAFYGITLSGVKLHVPYGTSANYSASSPWSEFQIVEMNPQGKCGEKLTWEYDPSTHALTITGDGEMDDFNFPMYIPWTDLSSEIESVILPEGLTHIGKYAFFNCNNPALTTIDIPNSVRSIGFGAFAQCSHVTSLTIPDGVTFIGQAAFRDTDLRAMIIPDGVTIIKNEMFERCSNLTSVTIPNSVDTIEDTAFASCTSLTSISLPEGLTSLGFAAFLKSGLTSIVIPQGVPELYGSTFKECGQLAWVDIPASVKKIGWGDFVDCGQLKDLYVHWDDPKDVEVNASAFFFLESPRAITLHVPYGTSGNYTSAPWSDFEIVEMKEDLTPKNLNIIENADRKTVTLQWDANPKVDRYFVSLSCNGCSLNSWFIKADLLAPIDGKYSIEYGKLGNMNGQYEFSMFAYDIFNNGYSGITCKKDITMFDNLGEVKVHVLIPTDSDWDLTPGLWVCWRKSGENMRNDGRFVKMTDAGGRWFEATLNVDASTYFVTFVQDEQWAAKQEDDPIYALHLSMQSDKEIYLDISSKQRIYSSWDVREITADAKDHNYDLNDIDIRTMDRPGRLYIEIKPQNEAPGYIVFYRLNGTSDAYQELVRWHGGTSVEMPFNLTTDTKYDLIIQPLDAHDLEVSTYVEESVTIYANPNLPTDLKAEVGKDEKTVTFSWTPSGEEGVSYRLFVHDYSDRMQHEISDITEHEYTLTLMDAIQYVFWDLYVYNAEGVEIARVEGPHFEIGGMIFNPQNLYAHMDGRTLICTWNVPGEWPLCHYALVDNGTYPGDTLYQADVQRENGEFRVEYTFERDTILNVRWIVYTEDENHERVSDDYEYSSYAIRGSSTEVPAPSKTYHLSLSAGMGGYVNTCVNGDYAENTYVYILAYYMPKWSFKEWSDGSKEQARYIQMDQDTTLQAIFETTNKFTLTIGTYDEEKGTVNEEVCGDYDPGETVVIEGVPESGYKFGHWTDGITEASREIVMDQDYTLWATFDEITYYSLTVKIEPDEEAGIVYFNNHRFGSNKHSYEEGTNVTLTVEENEGYTFLRWVEGENESFADFYKVQMDKGHVVTAVFKKKAQGLEEVTENGLPVTGKEIRNGQLIIRRGGRVYNAVGVLME